MKNTPDAALHVSSAVFGLLTAFQGARLLFRPDVTVNGHLFPLWPSVLAVGLLGGLSAWTWRQAGKA